MRHLEKKKALCVDQSTLGQDSSTPTTLLDHVTHFYGYAGLLPVMPITKMATPTHSMVLFLCLCCNHKKCCVYLYKYTLSFSPLITWRDVQHLLVKTSRPVHLKASDWKTNAAGHKGNAFIICRILFRVCNFL